MAGVRARACVIEEVCGCAWPGTVDPSRAASLSKSVERDASQECGASAGERSDRRP